MKKIAGAVLVVSLMVSLLAAQTAEAEEETFIDCFNKCKATMMDDPSFNDEICEEACKHAPGGSAAGGDSAAKPDMMYFN